MVQCLLTDLRGPSLQISSQIQSHVRPSRHAAHRGAAPVTRPTTRTARSLRVQCRMYTASVTRELRLRENAPPRVPAHDGPCTNDTGPSVGRLLVIGARKSRGRLSRARATVVLGVPLAPRPRRSAPSPSLALEGRAEPAPLRNRRRAAPLTWRSPPPSPP